MTFIEALQYAISRKVVLPAEYYQAMIDQQRKSAVSIAGLAQLEQIDFIIGEVNKAIENGGTFKDFLAKVRKEGVDDLLLPDYRIDNIFRTNIQTAYNHGRWQQQWANRDERPYLMYDAVNDGRTRPHHKALDNIIKPIDDVFWEANYTPNGFRCRCNIRALTEQQALKLGGVTVDVPANAKPDAGWATSPKSHNKTLQGLVEQYQPKKLTLSIKTKKALDGGKERISEKILREDIDIVNEWIPTILLDKSKSIYDDIGSERSKSIQKYNLNFSEFAAIDFYTGTGSHELNNFLNGKIGRYSHNESLYLEVTNLLNRALRKLPTYEGRVVRRADFSESDFNKHKIGNVVNYTGFTSSTYGELDVFSERKVRLIIQSKNGKKIDMISRNPNELEVLFGVPTSFLVENVKEYTNYTEIRLREL